MRYNVYILVYLYIGYPILSDMVPDKHSRYNIPRSNIPSMKSEAEI